MRDIKTYKLFKCFPVCGRDRLNTCVSGGGSGENKADSGELFLYSPLKVVIFVALMCGMLVLMYYFYYVLGEWDKKKNTKALIYSKGINISGVL